MILYDYNASFYPYILRSAADRNSRRNPCFVEKVNLEILDTKSTTSTEELVNVIGPKLRSLPHTLAPFITSVSLSSETKSRIKQCFLNKNKLPMY